MSGGAEGEAACPGGEETPRQLEARHEAEEAELQGRAQAHLESVQAASGGKGKKGKAAVEAAEREVEQWKYELSVRHKEELEALGELQAAAGGGSAGSSLRAAPGGSTARAPVDGGETAEGPDGAGEGEPAQRKKEKAQRKREQRTRKEAEREEEKERERLSAGPSRRQLELVAIASQLAARRPPLRVSEVLGDGHCLYRAVADQLCRYRPELHTWAKGPGGAYEEVRALCAGALRERREAYEPFAELVEGEDFPAYCERVERSADWGGELELRALADTLGARILVHRAGEAEPLALGAEGKGPPLQVTYHQHWYALGEHYNSAILQEGETDRG